MVSKTEMLKAIPRVKLASAVKKKRKKVPMSWNKEKIAEQLSFDELRKVYAGLKTVGKTIKKKVVKKKVSRKVVKKKVVRKKPAKRKVVRKVKKKTTKRKVKRRK